jgi:hypothetical protein
MPNTLSSSTIAELIYMPRVEEPSLKTLKDTHLPGVFIGKSYVYSVPVLINFSKLINPHILTIGMTGSGKTFLMKSLILRLSMLEESRVILIDFTGEYQNHLNLALDAKSEADLENDFEEGISYFNLANMPENQRISMSSTILEKCVLLMRKQRINAERRVFVVLDEAWKMLRTDKNLEMIIREGRKYGIGLVLSSQLVEDADNAVISNIATLFLFRTQNKKSLEKIAKNYNISEESISMVQGLELGSCLMVQLYKSSNRSAFIIRRVIGLGFTQTIKIKLGNNMGIEIGSEEFEKLLGRLCGDKSNWIAKEAKEKGEITLNSLIKNLIISGANKRNLLIELRKLGFDDFSIADSFAYALCEVGENK